MKSHWIKRFGQGFLFFLVLFVGALSSGCGQDQVGGSGQATPTPLPTPIALEKPAYQVQPGTVVNTLDFIGRVSPVDEQELFFKRDGFVAEVSVDRGDRVEAGDKLAELEIGDLQNRLAQQQLALQTAQVNLEKAKQANTDQLLEAQVNYEKLQLQMEQLQQNGDTSRIVAGRVNLQAAERELADAQEAYDKAWDEARDWEAYIDEPTCLPGQGGAVPCTGLPFKDRLENDRAGSEARLQRAQDNLTVARAEYNDAAASLNNEDYSVAILEKDIQLAEYRIAQLERGVDPLLALDVQRAELEIAAIEQQITDAQLIAPFAGEVLSVAIRPGDAAAAFKTVLVLADPDRLEITAELGSEDLTEMSVGQLATIRMRNRPEQDFSGQVRQLPYPYGGGTVETDESDPAVRVALDDPGVELEMGELANVIITLEEKADVLWLPPAALRTFQGRTFVVVQEADGSQRRVDVRLGIEGEDRVEILEGLSAGEVVVGE